MKHQLKKLIWPVIIAASFTVGYYSREYQTQEAQANTLAKQNESNEMILKLIQRSVKQQERLNQMIKKKGRTK